jgi:cytochrome c peroxidase
MSFSRPLLTGSLCLALVSFGTISVFGGKLLPNPLLTPDPSGVLSTYSTAGGIDINNPFFQSLGTNGRSCGTCHISSSAWTITPADVQAKFNGPREPSRFFVPTTVQTVPAQMFPQ